MNSFESHCAQGISANLSKIDDLMNRSLMLVTALNPHIGYDKSASIAKTAFEKNITLRQAALESGFVDPEQFDAWVRPDKMV